MSCEVANSPFSDHGFPDPFDNSTVHGNNTDLSALSAFDPNLSNIDQGCIDPQSLSNAGSPSNNHFDPTLTPDFTPNIYPSEFNTIPASPYFQSIEQQPFNTPFIPTLRNEQHHHRRSVSEPPDSALMHHFSQSSAPVTFHRDGHKLGVPRSETPLIKKVKASRAQPYQRNPRQTPQSQSQSRYQLRRAYTHLPPTSAPHGLPPGYFPKPQPMQPMHFDQTPQEPQYVSSRVRTPAPEAVDPFLGGAPAPMVAHMGPAGVPVPLPAFQGHVAPLANSVVIKMGIDELRALITEVVQKAVGDFQAGNNKAAAAAVAETVGGDDVGDEIVVAGSFTGGEGDFQFDHDLTSLKEE